MSRSFASSSTSSSPAEAGWCRSYAGAKTHDTATGTPKRNRLETAGTDDGAVEFEAPLEQETGLGAPEPPGEEDRRERQELAPLEAFARNVELVRKIYGLVESLSRSRSMDPALHEAGREV